MSGSGSHGVFSAKYEESTRRTVRDRTLIRRIYQYAKQFRLNLAIGVASIILGSVTGLFSPYLHKIAIDQIIVPNNLSGFLWWAPIFISVTVMNYVFQCIQVFQMLCVGGK